MLPSFTKPRQRGRVGLIIFVIILFVIIIKFCLLLLSSDDGIIYFNSSSIVQQEPMQHNPKISFVIPSMLNRPTLNRTLKSLLDQTHSDWEAIVGVDCVAISDPHSSVDNCNQTIAELSQAFSQDPRIRYLPVRTVSNFRGRKKNGSGQVRNVIIQDYARSDWVAMVDDDDTLSPYYVEAWGEAFLHHSTVDIVVFRMQDPKLDTPLPPLDNTHFLQAKREYRLANREGEVTWLGIGSVGISFAVRRCYWTQPKDAVIFVPHPSEDFNFLEMAQTKAHAQVVLASCCLYFIRQAPLGKETKPVCQWDASVQISSKAIQ